MNDALAEIVNRETIPGLRPQQELGEVIALLGEPEDVSLSKRPLILRYGSLELGFWEGPGSERRLKFMGVYFRGEGLRLPGALSRTTRWPTEPMSEMELLGLLASLGRPATVETRAEDSLVLRAGEVVRFVLAHDEETCALRLDSIQLLFD